MALSSEIAKVRATAHRLEESGGSNEANTKALVIEPLLSALGWDLTDWEQVDREYRVYDGTLLDYALKIDGKPRLFVEAKGAGKKLQDKQFIAQAVNYANNEGVPWCVLTNGTNYRVYKSNEPVGMAEKLLFEVDLKDEETEASDRVGDLELVSRKSVEEGRLDEWGERVFTDSRVRTALAEIAANPPTDLLSLVSKRLGQPQVAPGRLRESLARILGAELPSKPSPSRARKRAAAKNKKPPDYSLDRHVSDMPAGMVDLFEQIDDFGQSLGGDVTRRVRKMYVGYYAGSKERSFLTAEIRRQKVLVYLNLPPQGLKPWNTDAMRDVTDIGHYGMGDTEYVLRKPEQVEEIKALIKQAYDRMH